MANTILTSDIITKAALIDFEAELAFAMTCDRQWEPEFDKGQYSKGDTVNVRLPVQYIGGDGQVATVEDTVEKSAPLTINHQPHVRIGFNSKDLTLSIDEFRNRYTKQAMSTLANKCDALIASYTDDFYYWYGTPGTAVGSFATVNGVRGVMSKVDIPASDRYMALDFSSSVPLQNSLQNNFNNTLNTEISFDAQLGRLAAFDLYEESNILSHISGTGDGTAAVNGIIAAGTVKTAVSSGNSIIVEGLPGTTDGTFKEGDVIRIIASGLEIAHPKSHTANGLPPQFVVTADAAQTSAGGEVTIAVSPEIITDTTDPYQNINIEIPVGAVIELADSHYINCAYHQQAIAVVSPQLVVSADATGHYERDPKSKWGIRMTTQYDQANDEETMRFDLLLGIKIFPQLGYRLMG